MRSFCSLILVVGIFVASFNTSPVCARQRRSVKKACGPTINLDYGQDKLAPNPISHFMYFVPLVAHTPIESWMSSKNTQQAEFISHSRKNKGNSFVVKSSFKVSGKGSFRNIFDSTEMIEFNKQFFKKGATMKHLLDYIAFEGGTVGCMEVKGKTIGHIDTVEEVIVSFNCKGKKSPVIVAMHDIKPANGKYSYDNRINKIIARVNKLRFKQSSGKPRMTIEVASIKSAGKKDGLFASVTGMVANVFLPPMPVTQQGNDAMMSFGGALVRKESAYVFPKAANFQLQVAMAPQR
jgi:hypothetical protein